jgi:hypothetical protein
MDFGGRMNVGTALAVRIWTVIPEAAKRKA